jgi:hypothetical protein
MNGVYSKANTNVRLYGNVIIEKRVKYTTVWTTSGFNDKKSTIICFIDEAGNIYKPAGCKSPAKGIRGSVYDIESYKHADPYGGWLYAR